MQKNTWQLLIIKVKYIIIQYMGYTYCAKLYRPLPSWTQFREEQTLNVGKYLKTLGNQDGLSLDHYNCLIQLA